MEAKFLLRVEAVNFDAIIGDTDDLSTVRGGGILLLAAMDELKTALEAKFTGKIDVLSTGASVGLFLIDGDAAYAEAVRGRAESWLEGKEVPEKNEYKVLGTLSRHATFVCDIAEIVDDDIVAARKHATAKNRFRQMRTLSLKPPDAGATIEAGVKPPDIGKIICQIDHMRPSVETKGEKRDGEDVRLSRSVFDRRTFGREAKRKFLYRRLERDAGRTESDEKNTLYFSNDFSDIADDAKKESQNLDGKIAVIYADGNRFGKIEDKFLAADPKEGIRKYDAWLRKCRAELVLELVKKYRGDWKDRGIGTRTLDGKKEDYVKLETLLWGGDEFLWVVPASLGMATLSFLCEHSGKWGNAACAKDVVVTHGVGLVFCHKNAAIQRVRAVAMELAAMAKTVSREKTLIAYEVLESFDFPGRALAKHRAERLPRGFAPADLALTVEVAKTLVDAAAALDEIDFPRRRLLSLARVLQSEGAGPSFVAEEKSAMAAVEGAKKAIALVKEACGPLAWHHLETLWDYLVHAPGSAP